MSTPPIHPRSRHAGLEPRHGFLPPLILVHRLAGPGEAAWDAIPAVPLFTDLWGECVPAPRVMLRLAHDGTRIWLRAEVSEAAPVVRHDADPAGGDFWRQDHIELRLAADPAADMDQTQFILAADGRVWDNRGMWQSPELAGLHAGGGLTATGWRAWLGVPLGSFCGATPLRLLRGLVAHCRWADGVPDIVCATPAVLGFGHAERFAEFVLVDAPAPVRLEAVCLPPGPLQAGGQPVTLRLQPGQAMPPGMLRLLAERGGRSAACTGPLAAAPVVTLRLPLERPGYTRFGVWWEGPDGQSHALGAFTLRAAPAPFPPDAGRRPHPTLFFDAEGLRRLQQKARQPCFVPLVADWHRSFEAEDAAAPTGVTDATAFAFTPKCANWFRVARETMLRDGAGGRRPAAARIWSLLPAAAQAALHDIVRTVTPTRAQFDVLLPAMNALLARPDLYAADAFADVPVPPVARELLDRGPNALLPAELARLNRALLQAAIECVGAFGLDRAQAAVACADAWFASGDPRWIDLATARLETARQRMILGAQTHLHEGMLCGRLALAYDLFAPHLSASAQDVWLSVMDRFLQLYLDTARASAWTVTTVANANPVGNGGAGLLALALLTERPAAARTALDHARRNIHIWLDYCAGSDGGNTEGAQYWQYGMDHFLPFAMALERVLGHDDGLLTHPAVRRSMAMVAAGLTNDGALHGVNDTIPMPVGGATAWFVASRYGDAIGQWYGDHAARWLAARSAAGKPAVYGCDPWRALLFRANVPEAIAAPPLPVAIRLGDVQVATLRAAPRWDAVLVAGLKGSRPPYTHHNQADTGSFWLDVRGERLLIDPGYYKPAARDHSLPVVGGRAPTVPTAFAGEIVQCGADGSLRVAVCDSSAAYGVAGWRVVRHLVMAGDQAVVLLDDIVAEDDDGPVAVVSAFQCGGPAARVSRMAVSIQGARTALRLRLFPPSAGSRLERHAERSLHDTHWGYHFADCRWFPVTVCYRAEAPLVSVITEEAGGAALPCRVRRRRDTIVVAVGDHTIAFRRDAGGWCTAGTTGCGVETDS